jgi:hypothetical protein
MTQSPATRQLPAGPAERFDIHPNDESFTLISGLFERYGDICMVEPLARKAPSYVIHHPDYIKHVLVGRAQNYIKGVGFERVKMLLDNGIIVRGGQYWKSQRYMIHESEASRQPHKFAYFPFSIGQRRCIDELFATVEMQIHLGAVAKRLRLRYVPEQPVGLEPRINLRTRGTALT